MADANSSGKKEQQQREVDHSAAGLLKVIESKWITQMSRKVSKEGVSPNSILTEDGETGVHACIRLQGEREDPYYEPVLRCLLRQGADPNVKTDTGLTPAHYAASYDLVDVLSLLLEFKADVDVEDLEGYAPVHICAEMGKANALEWLCTKGKVPVEREHSSGFSLAMFSANAGHLETLKCLKRLGANLRKPCKIYHELVQAQRVKASIMAMALYNGRDDVADWLADECDIGKHESEIVVEVDPEAEAECWRQHQEYLALQKRAAEASADRDAARAAARDAAIAAAKKAYEEARKDKLEAEKAIRAAVAALNAPLGTASADEGVVYDDHFRDEGGCVPDSAKADHSFADPQKGVVRPGKSFSEEEEGCEGAQDAALMNKIPPPVSRVDIGEADDDLDSLDDDHAALDDPASPLLQPTTRPSRGSGVAGDEDDDDDEEKSTTAGRTTTPKKVDFAC